MKRLFYLLFGLVLLPALLYAQGSLSPKDINDNLTNNYYNKTASDARYATTTYGYSSAEVDILLAPKADKTYVNATDEAIILDLDSVEVVIQNLLLEDASLEIAIQNLLFDNDSQDVTIEANKVGVASLEVGLQTHQNNLTGAHAATAISATWTNVQVSLDSIEAAMQGIVVGSGFATEAWVNSTLETNFYNAAQTNATIEAAIAAIPAPNVNQTITVTAGEALTAGQVVSLINESGTMKAYHNPLTVSTGSLGTKTKFSGSSAITSTYVRGAKLDSEHFVLTYASGAAVYAVAASISRNIVTYGSPVEISSGGSYPRIASLDATHFVVTYRKTSDTYGYAKVGIVSGNTISETGAESNWSGTTVGGNMTQITALDSTHFVIAYYDNTDSKYGNAVIGVTDGNKTISSYGTKSRYSGTNVAYYNAIATLDSTHFVIAYGNNADSNHGYAVIGECSGTTISGFGTPVKFLNGSVASTGILTVGALDSTHFVIAYNNGADSGHGYAIVGATSGTSISSYGTHSEFKGASVSDPIISSLDSTHFLISWISGAASGTRYAIIGETSGTSITGYGSESTITTSATTTTKSCSFATDSTHFVFAYSDSGVSDYGHSFFGLTSDTTISGYYIYTSNYSAISGTSQGAYSSGSDAVVLISGSYDGLSSLIPGSPYFVNASFELQTTPVSLTSTIYSGAATTREIHFGTAKSSTEIVLNIDYR